MDKKVFNVQFLPPGAPYSHAVAAQGMIFVSGILPVNRERDLAIKDDIAAATTLVLENMAAVLAEAGADLSQVVKVTVFLRDMAYYQEMNQVYARFFPENPPARSCVAVKEIPGNYPLEIEAVAFRS
jgi:2-iminobutanoate/2-iminopropanoate deaminase